MLEDTGKRGKDLWGTADDPGAAELAEHMEELGDETEMWSLVYMIGFGEDRGLFGFADERQSVEKDTLGTLTEALQGMIDNMTMTEFIKGNYKVIVEKE